MRSSDWSSDVCSSDLAIDDHLADGRGDEEQEGGEVGALQPGERQAAGAGGRCLTDRFGQRQRDDRGEHEGGRPDRKSVVEGKGVSVRVDLGGRRNLKKRRERENRAIVT